MRISPASTTVRSHAQRLRQARPVLVIFVIACFSFLGGIMFHRQGYLWKTKHLPKQILAKVTAPQIPIFRLDVKFRNAQKLLAKRQEALARGILISNDQDPVTAKIQFGNQTMGAQIRLKGDLPDHFRDRNKLSYRVKMKGKGHVLGMRVFSLQSPTSRQWDTGWLIYEHYRLENVLSLRYLPVRLVTNGEDNGIYALEEHFSKELLESQQRREGVLFRFDESALWQYLAKGGLDNHPKFDMLRLWTSSEGYPVKEFRSSKVSRDPTLARQRDAAIQLMTLFRNGKLPASQVFKIEETARFLAVSELWQNWHSMFWTNLRFYYDPIEGRIEPVAFDARVETDNTNFFTFMSFELQSLDLINQLTRDPQIAEAYVRHMHRMIQPGYLEGIQEKLQAGWQDFATILSQEWPDAPMPGMKTTFKKRDWLNSQLGMSQIAFGHSRVSEPDADTEPNADQILVEIQLTNPTGLPVQVVSAHWPDDSSTPKNVVFDQPWFLEPRSPVSWPFKSNDHGPRRVKWNTYQLQLPADTKGLNSLTLSCRFIGSPILVKITVPLFQHALADTGPRPKPVAIHQVLKNHPFLVKSQKANTLEVKTGIWNVIGDLALPDGFSLLVHGQTTLRFQPGAVLILTGQLHCRGTIDAPVRFEPSQDAWGGILVLNASSSQWDHVTVSGTNGIQRTGLTTTGGVCFYRSPIELNHCHFDSSLAEDALNVVRSRITARNVTFANTQSDAFDGDFVVGTFADCGFTTIGGDAIDVSGSLIYATRIHLTQIADKAISIGEHSELEADGLTIRDARMAIVSKDRSQGKIRDVEMTNVEYGVAAYVKKPEYGPAFLQVDGARLNGVGTESLVERGSKVVLNAKIMPESDVDVIDLYVEEPTPTKQPQTALGL